jgi:hypothetical protein
MKWRLIPGSVTQKMAERYLAKKEYTQNNPRLLKNWNDVQTIVFLVDGTKPEALRLVLNRLHTYEKAGKKISIFGYVRKHPPFDQDGIYWFTNADLNWYGLPGISVLKALHLQPFDLLINMGQVELQPLHYIAALSHAQLRIGPYHQHWSVYYDFMIMQEEENDFNDLLDKIEYYLNTFNKQDA